MFKLSEKPRALADFEANKGNQKQTFHQVQRFMWEKAFFPERFPGCSIFLCRTCNSKTRDLSFCLQCGRCYCGEHFKDHRCPPGYGVDVLSRQLFLFDPAIGRRFIFDASIDRLIISAKLAVIDGLPFDADLDPIGPVLPVRRPPMPLQNLGNTCWLNSLLQCLAVNPLLQKWFLSGQVDISPVDCAEAAVHCHLTRFFLAQMMEGSFSLADFVFAVWTLFEKFATPEQCDAHEFFMQLRSKLDEFYQRKFDMQVFNEIFGWQFKVIESCESCDDTRIFMETAADMILPIAKTSSLNEAISQYLLGSSPRSCNACDKPCKRQCYFHTLPPTLTIALARGLAMDKGAISIALQEELILDDFVDADKKPELGEARYSLIGMVVRPGAGETGHYWANVKRWGQWFKCDDNNNQRNVQEVELSEVLRSDACLLFFTRMGIVPQ